MTRKTAKPPSNQPLKSDKFILKTPLYQAYVDTVPESMKPISITNLYNVLDAIHKAANGVIDVMDDLIHNSTTGQDIGSLTVARIALLHIAKQSYDLLPSFTTDGRKISGKKFRCTYYEGRLWSLELEDAESEVAQ